MVALSLFCVTIRGLESSLPTPLDSAAVMKKSTAKFGDRCASNKPLVGALAGRFTFRGSDGGVEFATTIGGGGVVPPKLLVPTWLVPPAKDRPLVAVPAKPNC